jgi:hypothetical protein
MARNVIGLSGGSPAGSVRWDTKGTPECEPAADEKTPALGRAFLRLAAGSGATASRRGRAVRPAAAT